MESSGKLSAIVHLKNSNISQFDYHLVDKLNVSVIQWHSENDQLHLTLNPVSPCDMKSPEDGADVTWIGYSGQLVPSGNLIDGPICVDEQDQVVTRSCGLPKENFQVIAQFYLLNAFSLGIVQ